MLRATFGSLLDLRRGEGALAALLFAYSFVLLAVLYLLKPARDSLFLIEVGPAQLPFVFLAVAVAVVPVTLLYGWAGRHVRIATLANGTTLALVVSLIGIRLAVGTGAGWVYFLFYVWVSTYSVLATSQFWLLAGAVFDASQAKRLFSLLSLGAILGAIVGGEATGLLIDKLSVPTVDLLWVCVGLLVGTIALTTAIRRFARAAHAGQEIRRTVEAEDPRGPLALVAGSRHLQLIVAVIGVAVLTTTLVDYQFKTFSHAAIPIENDLTAFMGRFYGRVSLVALALQILLAPRLIRLGGIGWALLLLPAALVGGTLALLVLPGLLAATALRGLDQTLKHSIDRTGRELLFLPVAQTVKTRVKVFIDVFVDQGAQGLAGVVLLALTAGLGFGPPSITLVVLGLLVLWVGLAVWARRSYIDAFRAALPREEVAEAEAEEPAAPLEAPDPATLAAALDEPGHEEEAVAALDALAAAGAEVPDEQVERILRQGEAAVRARALGLLREREDYRFTALVTELLRDPDDDVRLEAARYLFASSGANRSFFFRMALEHPDARVRAATVEAVAESGTEVEKALVTDAVLIPLLHEDGLLSDDVKAQMTRALGLLGRPEHAITIRRLLDDRSLRVVEAAIEAAGHSGERMFVSRLIRLLGDPALAEGAYAALRAYGARIYGTLYDHLTDDTVDETVRQAIPSLLSHEPSQAAVDVLLLSLERLRPPVLFDAIKALGKHRASGVALRFSEGPVDAAVVGELRGLGFVRAVLFHFERSVAADGDPFAAGPDAIAVRAAVLDERAQSIERITRLLGLKFFSADMHAAYLGLTEGDTVQRAGAVEFLDNLLDWNTKRVLLPFLDERDDFPALDLARELSGRPLLTWQEALAALLLDRQPRPLACALASLPSEALPPDLSQLAHVACTTDPTDDPPEMRARTSGAFGVLAGR